MASHTAATRRGCVTFLFAITSSELPASALARSGTRPWWTPEELTANGAAEYAASPRWELPARQSSSGMPRALGINFQQLFAGLVA